MHQLLKIRSRLDSTKKGARLLMLKEEENFYAFLDIQDTLHSQDLTLYESLDNRNGMRWSILQISVINFVDNS